jgi:hypothetical protein
MRTLAGGIPVKMPREFWPLMHLACARFEASGTTHQQRLQAAMEDYASLSDAARRDLLRELRALMSALHDLEPLAMVEALTDKEGCRRAVQA